MGAGRRAACRIALAPSVHSATTGQGRRAETVSLAPGRDDPPVDDRQAEQESSAAAAAARPARAALLERLARARP
jgi:hypothetical protein